MAVKLLVGETSATMCTFLQIDFHSKVQWGLEKEIMRITVAVFSLEFLLCSRTFSPVNKAIGILKIHTKNRIIR